MCFFNEIAQKDMLELFIKKKKKKETLYEITALYSSSITINLIMFQLFYYYQLWMQSKPKLHAMWSYFV